MAKSKGGSQMSDIECTHSDCYWQIGMKAANECWHCTRNTAPPVEHMVGGERKDNFISVVDKITELYTYLVETQKLGKQDAFAVIHFLQEWTCCLPDHIEQCDGCLDLYDEHQEGYYLDDDCTLDGQPLPQEYHGSWCGGGCEPNVDFKYP